MKTFSGIFFLILITGIADAQRICGSATYTQQLLKSNPSLQASLNKAEEQIKKTIRFAGRDTVSNELISVPVVVHVVYKTAEQNISDEQVLSQLEALNKDFSAQNSDRINTPQVFKNLAADSRIKFCLARVDPQGRSCSGITRKKTTVDNFTADDAMKFDLQGGTNGWDSKKYLNIWVCAMSSRSLGYASLPGSEADKDGVVIAYDAFGTKGTLRPVFNKGRTATHEIGHWMGLKHLWGDLDCGDDAVDDTPTQQSYNFGCPSFPKMSPCSPNANGDMFMNYMDFSDDGCMNMFTVGQKRRMRAVFAAVGVRNSFLNSYACDSNLAQAGPLAVPEAGVPAGVTTTVPAFKVYPNPVSSLLTLESSLEEVTVKTSVQIFNATGKLVFTAEISNAKSSFNVSGLPAGFYIIKAGEGANRFTGKFVKQ